MPVKELIEKYGGKTSVALRRAVRAEIPGGSDLFDALQIAARNRYESDDWRRLHNALIRTREAFFKDVARKYGFKSATRSSLGEAKGEAEQ